MSLWYMEDYCVCTGQPLGNDCKLVGMAEATAVGPALAVVHRR